MCCILFGRRLRASRVAIGFGVGAFAAELGLSSEDYEKIENGNMQPDLDTLICIAKLTDRSLDFLIAGSSA